MKNSRPSPLDIHQVLKRFDLSPRKSLGQNFLVDEAALARVVSIARVTNEDEVLEIGPGLGSLTRHLALAARNVTAVEIDRNLFPALESVLAPYRNVKLICADIMQTSMAQIMSTGGFLVVANIPYYITSALIRHLLESSVKPRRVVLTVQYEVAERICAQPGKLSLLALGVQVYGNPSIALKIPAAAFHPTPNVDSAVVAIEINERPVIPEHLLDDFFAYAKAGFSQKRKTLRNSLSAGLRLDAREVEKWLLKAGIDPQRRAETLSLEEWSILCNTSRE